MDVDVKTFMERLWITRSPRESKSFVAAGMRRVCGKATPFAEES